MTLDLCPFLTSEHLAEPCPGCKVKRSQGKEKTHRFLLNSCLAEINNELMKAKGDPKQNEALLLEIYKLKRVTTLEDDEANLDERSKEKTREILNFMDLLTLKLSKKDKVQYHLDYGGVLFNMGEYGRAKKYFIQISRTNPEEKRAWNNIGVTLVREGREKEAFDYYDRALEMDSTYGSAWFNKGKALFKVGHEKKALECFRKATKHSPENQSAWNNLGVTLRHMGKFRESIKCYNKALKIHSAYHWAWHNKGVALMELKRFKDAMVCFEKALQINPDYRPAKEKRREVLRKFI